MAFDLGQVCVVIAVGGVAVQRVAACVTTGLLWALRHSVAHSTVARGQIDRA
jgi:hypothetical protein